jgi:hypothetical protein
MVYCFDGCEKKAFDVGLFREIFKMNITGDNWLLFKEWYRNLTTKIKWEARANFIWISRKTKSKAWWRLVTYSL